MSDPTEDSPDAPEAPAEGDAAQSELPEVPPQPERPGLGKTKPAAQDRPPEDRAREPGVRLRPSGPLRRLAQVTKAEPAEAKAALAELIEEYEPRGVQLVEVAGGYVFRSAPVSAPFVREIIAQRPVRMSRAQLEVLAIVAYRQPLTRPEVEDIRGVDSASALKVLLERGLLKVLGRKDEPGRPLLYGTSKSFLEVFGFRSLDDLPTLKEFSELTEESRALFARRSGEQIESIGSIQVDENTAAQTDAGRGGRPGRRALGGERGGAGRRAPGRRGRRGRRGPERRPRGRGPGRRGRGPGRRGRRPGRRRGRGPGRRRGRGPGRRRGRGPGRRRGRGPGRRRVSPSRTPPLTPETRGDSPRAR